MTTAEVQTEFALNVIERTNSLQILAFFDHHEESGDLILPTWIPDRHALNLVAPMRCPTQGAIETAESQKGMVLKCHGSFIDTLQAKSDMIKFTVTTREKETQKKIPFLINHIWNKTVVEPRIPLVSAGELIASLTIVLTGGYLNESDSTSGGRIFLPAYHLKRKHLYRHWLPEALHIDSSRI